MLFQILVLFFVSSREIGAKNSTSTNSTQVEVQNKTVVNGKTYFIQLKKVNDGEDSDAPVYMKINHYRDDQGKERKEQLMRKYEEMFGKLSQIPDSLKEIDEDVEEIKETEDVPNYIDDEWSYNVNHSNYDLPNITHEIYDAMLENNKHNTIKNATTVKFFFEVDTNLTSNIVKFDVESLENITEKIVDAELHVYRLPRDKNTTKPNATENVVRLYQMTNSGESVESNKTVAKPIPDVHKLANVIYISSNYAGWQVFKVKNVVENWKNGENNLGFLISTTDSWEKEYVVDFAHREKHGGKYQPTLVVYLDRQEPGRKHHSRKQKPKKPFRPTKMFKELLAKSFNPCSRHVWYISFHELGWNNFIVAPTGYMAYACKGSCSSPLDTTYSNHGKLVNLFRRTGDSASPCCVPNSYKSLLIMYYDRDSNVVIKDYDDMVVVGCGCR